MNDECIVIDRRRALNTESREYDDDDPLFLKMRDDDAYSITLGLRYALRSAAGLADGRWLFPTRACVFRAMRPGVKEWSLGDRNAKLLALEGVVGHGVGVGKGNPVVEVYVLKSAKTRGKVPATIDGVPTNDNRNGFCRARLMEVTPEKEIVFDMWIDGSKEEPPVSLSSFRSEFLTEKGFRP